MKRLGVGWWIAGCGVVVALAVLGADEGDDVPTRADPSDLPNIVLIIIDTLRADRLAIYGHPHDTAPYLTKLAADSVVFERAYSPSSWTVPATASIFTSTYPLQHQVHTGYFVTRAIQRKRSFRLNRIPDSLPTLPETLKQRGYRTYGVADNLNISERMGFSRGFDSFIGYDYQGAPAVNAAIDELSDGTLEGDSPYFLYVHYMDPHEPYGKRMEHYDEKASGGELFASYDSEIGFTDAHIGALIGNLDAGPDTVIVVTADHGEEFGDHGNHGHRNQLYDELLHVPLIISWPGRLAPRRVAHNVSTVDIMPMLLSLLKINVAANAATKGGGATLMPSIDRIQAAHQPVFASRRSEQLRPPLVRKSVIWQHWKYVWSMPSGRQELYDRLADPGERMDLQEQHPEISTDLHERLLGFEQNAQIYERSYTTPRQLTEQMEERLRAIGYTEE
jgi:arylsulfatase A-like enzyme